MVSSYRQINPEKRKSESLPVPPKFILHDEIFSRGSHPRLFRRSIELPSKGRLPQQDELVLFKRMHYCGYRLSQMWDRLDRLTLKNQAHYLRWYEQYLSIRDHLVHANMGLVFSMLTKSNFTNVDFEELRSEGLMALLRAVDSFDPWRGFRFSTYACNSIRRAFSRFAFLENRNHHLIPSSFDPKLESNNCTETQRQNQEGLLIERLLAIMDDQETELSKYELLVLKHRFPLHPGKKKATLKVVGKKLKFSKERVRQIQNSAVNKLRQALLNDPVFQ